MEYAARKSGCADDQNTDFLKKITQRLTAETLT